MEMLSTSSAGRETVGSRRLAFFLAHSSIAAYYSLVGIWWTYNVLRSYHLCRLSKGKKQFRSEMFYAGPGKLNLPLEIVCKILSYSLLDVLVVGACVLPGFHCQFAIHSRHLLMSAPFLMSAIVDLMVHYDCASLHLPRGTERAMLALATALGGFLIDSHNHGASSVNGRMHAFMPWFGCAIAAALVVEGRNRSSVFSALARCFLFTLAGAWIAQIAHDLFPVMPWQNELLDEESPTNVANVSALFAYHTLTIAALFIAINAFAIWKVSPSKNTDFDVLKVCEYLEA